ncbi:MAG: hypothetical protein ACXVCF_02135, partial [Isosphaeraceae bacterium]
MRRRPGLSQGQAALATGGRCWSRGRERGSSKTLARGNRCRSWHGRLRRRFEGGRHWLGARFGGRYGLGYRYGY